MTWLEVGERELDFHSSLLFIKLLLGFKHPKTFEAAWDAIMTFGKFSLKYSTSNRFSIKKIPLREIQTKGIDQLFVRPQREMSAIKLVDIKNKKDYFSDHLRYRLNQFETFNSWVIFKYLRMIFACERGLLALFEKKCQLKTSWDTCLS